MRIRWTNLEPFRLASIRSEQSRARRIGFAPLRGTQGKRGALLVQFKGKRAQTYVCAPIERSEYARILELDRQGVLRAIELQAILESASLACQVSPIVRRLDPG